MKAELTAQAGLLNGKKGVIMGIANAKSIAAHCAQYFHAHGAQLGYSHLPDQDERGKMKSRVLKVVGDLEPSFVLGCDVGDDQQIDGFFAEVGKQFGSIDFLIHSIAFAPIEDLRCPTVEASRQGFATAMDVSVYSLMRTCRAAAPLMEAGGSVVTMTYFGGEKTVAGYNLMGLCKSALDSAVRYLAYDLGPRGIRVNAVSAGPIKTLASSAIGDFGKMLKVHGSTSPLGRCVDAEEVAKASAFLVSDLSSGITGEVMHVDAGYNTIGGLGRLQEHFDLVEKD